MGIYFIVRRSRPDSLNRAGKHPHRIALALLLGKTAEFDFCEPSQSCCDRKRAIGLIGAMGRRYSGGTFRRACTRPGRIAYGGGGIVSLAGRRSILCCNGTKDQKDQCGSRQQESHAVLLFLARGSLRRLRLR